MIAAALVAWLLATPLSAAAQACEGGAISEITFDSQKPFSPEEATGEGFFGSMFAGMNSVHVSTREGVILWELLFAEGDCFDPLLLEESERNLRSLPYMASALIESEQLADGSYRVDIRTVDSWALAIGLAVTFDQGFEIRGFSANAKNLFGTGTSAAYFRNTFRERKRTGGLGRQPNLFGSRIDATFHGGNTRAGTYYSESLYRPFTGETGRSAFRQRAHQRGDYFSYSVEPSLGFTQALLRFEAEHYEATYQHRFGGAGGPRFLVGVGLSREVVRFPFGAAGGQVVVDSDFDEPMQAPTEVLTEISRQARDHATNRASFTIGLRNLSFSTQTRLDALDFTQDIQLGSDFTLTVAPGVPTGDDAVSDVLIQVQGRTGLTAGRLYLVTELDLQTRHVSSDDAGGPTGWRDVLWEINGTGYWTFSETSTLFSRVLFTSGSSMDRPFQLTLGGQEAVRGYDDDAFPGAKRVLVTLEQRIPLPGVDISLFDLGLAAFADAGKMWAGNVPYGADSDWKAGIGFALRIRPAASGQNVLRLDFGLPLTGQREEKGIVFRFYGELFGLLDRRAWPTQAGRSRWYGIDPDLTTRPVNPLAGN